MLKLAQKPCTPVSHTYSIYSCFSQHIYSEIGTNTLHASLTYILYIYIADFVNNIYLYIHSVLALKQKLGPACKAAFVADQPQVSAGQQQVSDVVRSIGDRMPQHTAVFMCVCLCLCVCVCS